MRLADYAGHLGLAFQIRDDLLDVEGDAEAVGKGVRKDAGAGKATFVSLLGVDGARRAAADEVAAATAALEPFRPARALVARGSRICDPPRQLTTENACD